MWEALRPITSHEETVNSLEEGNERARFSELTRRKKRGKRKWVDDDRKEESPLSDESYLSFHR